MKIPISPPDFDQMLQGLESKRLPQILTHSKLSDKQGYLHWDQLRHRTPPDELSHEEWWFAIKFARKQAYRRLPLIDKQGTNLGLVMTDNMHRRLVFMDREAAGSIEGADRSHDQASNRRYLIRSLIEEAITSAQLEGASTTKEIAKDMLRSGRKPRDLSEQMIANNYEAMRQIRGWIEHPLTTTRIFEIHRIITADTLEDPSAAGRFRLSTEKIAIYDNTDSKLLHQPPVTQELSKRLKMLCDFANDVGEEEEEFIHPLVRAIILHFQLAYDHPFVDGNGRVARALFYWLALRSGYWLTEYLSISSVLKLAPAKYAKSYLYTESDDFDVSYFVDHQLDVIRKAVDQLRKYIGRKVKESRDAEQLIRPDSKLGVKLNHRQHELLLEALRNPGKGFSIAHHQQRQNVSYPTARSDLLGLAERQLLLKMKRGRTLLFHSPDDLRSRLESD